MTDTHEASPTAKEELDKFLVETQDLGNAELLEAAISLASSLGISHDSFKGRERDALQSLVGVATYYRLGDRERQAVLQYTHNTFFLNANDKLNRPAFVLEVRTQISHMMVQPAWYQTSVSNKDLKENAILWGVIRVIANILTKGVPAGAGATATAGKILMPKRTDEIVKKIYNQTKDLRNAGRIGSFSPPGIFLTVGIMVATSQYGAMMKEVELRIDRGQMTSKDRRDIQESIKDKTYGLSDYFL
ncbi:hypothetical protein ACRQ1B_08900 [Rhizobium panacihumi]|uniref:hypothetical protein n=1 Tax=Rhizobium panacihumi TaxID=2008450 RepID=UPI003D7BF438